MLEILLIQNFNLTEKIKKGVSKYSTFYVIFFSLKCPKFRLKQCGRPESYQNLQKIKFQVVWGELESKTGFQSE